MELILSMSTHLSSWDERVQAQSQLHDISTQIATNGSLIHCEILLQDFHDIVSLLDLFHKRNVNQQWNSRLDNFLARWKCDVERAECRKLLGILEEAIAAGKPLGKEGDYLPDACVFYISLKLLVLVLESNAGMSEALCTPEAVSLSWLLVSIIRLHDKEAMWSGLWLWRYSINKLLFLGGAALSPSVVADGYSKLDING